MDIVYTLRACNVCEELAYSLRSLCNLPHDRIFFVGGFPNNINRNDIIYIPTVQNSTKWKNALQNIRIACQDERLSEDFILMNDDFFILKPVRDYKELSLNQGTVADIYSQYQKRGSSSLYAQGMKETAEYMYRLGIKMPLSFELHIPMIFNKRKLLETFRLPGVNDIAALHIRSLYGNIYIKDSVYRHDVKVLANDDFLGANDTFLSCGDFTWKKVKPFLEQLFPDKSKYES